MAQVTFNILMLLSIWLFFGGLAPWTLAVLPIIYYFLVFYRSKKRAEALYTKLTNTLMQNEQAIERSLQFRPFALLHRRYLLTITNSRVLLIMPKLFGGFAMRDIQWKDLQDVQLSENVFPNFLGSQLNFKYHDNNPKKGDADSKISINGIDSHIASQIYSVSQAKEQEWEEKRRIREMEEKRAAAGGVIVHTGKDSESTTKNKEFSVIEKIQQAKDMLDIGTISDVEFQEIKSKILSNSI